MWVFWSINQLGLSGLLGFIRFIYLGNQDVGESKNQNYGNSNDKIIILII